MDLYELEPPTSHLAPSFSFEMDPVLWGVSVRPLVPLPETEFLTEAFFLLSNGNREALTELLRAQGEDGYKLFTKLWPKSWRWGDQARRMLVEVWSAEVRAKCKEATHLLFLSACALGMVHVLDVLLPFVDRAVLPFGEKQGCKHPAVRRWFAAFM